MDGPCQKHGKLRMRNLKIIDIVKSFFTDKCYAKKCDVWFKELENGTMMSNLSNRKLYKENDKLTLANKYLIKKIRIYLIELQAKKS